MAPNTRRYKVLAWTAGAFVLLAFSFDVVAQVIVLSVSQEHEAYLESLVGSFCFSQGSGYEAVVELRDTLKAIRRNSAIMIGMAVAGVFAEFVQLVMQCK